MAVLKKWVFRAGYPTQFLFVAIALAVVTSCSGSRSDSSGSQTSTSTSNSSILQVPDEVLKPGEHFDVRFESPTQRSLYYLLCTEIGNCEFLLASNRAAGGGNPVALPIEEVSGRIDIGVSDAGPDTLVVPETILSQAWLLCVDNDEQNTCASIEIGN